MSQAYVSVGSNIDREHNIRSAVSHMRRHFPNLTLSSVYESEAEGFQGDPFYNLVAGFEFEGDIHELVKVLRQIEDRHGRTRGGAKFSSRTLDLDLLLFDDVVIPELDVPRKEITRYAFVLWPLAELAPRVSHPLIRQTFDRLWQRFKAEHPETMRTIRPIELLWNEYHQRV
jgi:2-amino-4-hydroxy-6-hydroxymethyldihydropteridine diphosphokinase